MSVLDRAALEASPLADLHTIASELSLDGYRRLRKADLIDRILARQDGTETDASEAAEDVDAVAAESPSSGEESGSGRRRRGRRGGRGRGAAREEDNGEGDGAGSDERESAKAPAAEASPRRRGGARAEASDSSSRESSGRESSGRESSSRQGSGREEAEVEEVVEGVVDLLANGSGFLRVSPPDPADDDVYISAAQVKRCELVTGDRIAGPKRAPRRSERFASLVRIDTINDRPASEVADGARFDELPAAFPSDRFRFGSEDPTLKAIEFLTPFGRGSRVTIVGGPRSGKSHALRLVAQSLAGEENLQMFVALAGVRPEEISEWSGSGADDSAGTPAPSGALSFASSADSLDHLVELAVDQASRVAARGSDVVVVIDTLDGLHRPAARKALAAARNIVDGGSLTVIATSSEPVGGETTVITLDAQLTSTRRFPALDLVASGTIRPELLVGDAGAEAIAEARAQALGG